VTNTLSETYAPETADLEDALRGLEVVDGYRYDRDNKAVLGITLAAKPGTNSTFFLRLSLTIDRSYNHQGHAKVERYGADGWHEVAHLPGEVMAYRYAPDTDPIDYVVEAHAARLILTARRVVRV
jgi:hypothetical protein